VKSKGGTFVPFLFENLEVYQRAVNFAETIAIVTKNLPAQGHYHLVDQLRRASLSISLNIAEGNGRWHVKDRKNFFWIARGSVFECVPLLELCKREKLITEDTWADLKAELEVLSKMLTALINATAKRRE
jgi:four helix bundle protein